LDIDFDYENKGKAIPPPKNRKPDKSNYYLIDPSPSVFITQDDIGGH